MCTYTSKHMYVLECRLSHGGVVLRGLWGLCINTQTSAQTHPAARSHHVVKERGQSVTAKKVSTAKTKSTDKVKLLAQNSGDKCGLVPFHPVTIVV